MRELLKRPIAFHPVLARLFGGINEAILWQQIHYWSERCDDDEGWVYKSKTELEFETTLTRDQQDRARKSLEKNGYLKSMIRKRPKDGAPTLYYQCQIGLVENQLIEKAETRESIEKRETRESSITESTREYLSANAEKNEPSDSEEDWSMTGLDGDEEKEAKKNVNRDVLQVFGAFKGINPEYVLWRKRPAQRDAAKVLLKRYGLDKTINLISASQKVKGGFAPQVYSPYDLLKKLPNLKSYEERGNRETD